MKRTLYALLVALTVLSAFDGAAAKKRTRKPPKEVTVQAVVIDHEEAERATTGVQPEKKQSGDNSFRAPSSEKKPIKAGKPVEKKLTKASGRVFDLRAMPSTKPRQKEKPERHGPEPTPGLVDDTVVSTLSRTGVPRLPVTQAAAPAPLITFEGLDRENWGSGSPPDTTGDVGPDYYIQSVNSSVGIYRKSDGFQEAAFTYDTLMAQGNFGNLCDNENFGDPVILYDTFDDRWILTDFAFALDGGGNVSPPVAYQCFAVSMTGDPIAGGWNFYSIENTDGLNDYPKLGVWPDGIYMSANMFGFPAGAPYQGARVWVLNKEEMYAGSPTVRVVSFDFGTSDFTIIPSNARLQTGTPPTGTPNYFLSTWNFLNAVTVYKFHVDWSDIPSSTFTGPDTPLAATSWPNAAVANVPQLGTATLLDALQIRAMVQNQYTNMSGVESLWVPHTVRRAAGGSAAPRWYQVDVSGGTVAANIPQAATWDPDAANGMNRWMPSLAIDRGGNMALGYSISSSAIVPGIAYAGRLATDPINTFSQTEQILFAGVASQTGSSRWGDYSSMMLDPDGCTFWFTSEYGNTDQAANRRWKTRIGAFKYPECTPVGAGGTISGTVTVTPGGAPISGATVQVGARSTTTNGSGFYSFTALPAGTYPSMIASFAGYTSDTASSVVVTDGGTTTEDFSLAAAAVSDCPVDTTQGDFLDGIATDVDLNVSPGDIVIFKPTLDQGNGSIGTSGVGITITTWGGQTFTPSVTGTLTKVDLNLFCSGCTGTTPNLTLSIRATAAGLPTGADLASATIPGFSNGGVASYFTATFGVPPALTAGTMYAIVIRPTVNPVPGTYALTRSGTSTLGANVYPSGTRVAGATSGTVWSIPTTGGVTTDAGFRTYMDSGYGTSGEFVSSVKDSNPLGGLTPVWTTLSWTATTPANTTVRFQVGGSNDPFGPFNFVGPDGTAATYFTTSGAALTQFYDFRYLKYAAYLDTTDTTVTPTVHDVTLCYTDTDCSGGGPTITPTPAQACPNSTGNTASAPAGATSYAWSITNGTITGGAATNTVTYDAGASGTVDLTLNIVDAAGCHESTTINVPIGVPPTPTVTPGGPTTFCAGGSVTLTSSSATGNQWYDGVTLLAGETNSTYVATASGDYNVVVSVDGCPSAPSSSTTVTVNPIPNAPVITPDGPTTFCAGDDVTLTSSSASGNQWYDGATLLVGETNQTYVATTSGSYNVVVTALGCSSAPSASTVVTVNSTPTPTVTPGGPTTFCTGGSVTLTSSSATGNQWYDGVTLLGGETNQTYVATTSGSYNVVVTANGCPSAPSSSTAVTVNPIPATPTVTPDGPTTFCAGDDVTLTSSSASGNQWYDGVTLLAGETNQTYVATTSGNYNVVVTTSGCSSAPSSSTTVTVNPAPATPTITPGGPTTFCTGGSVTLTSSSATGNQWYDGVTLLGGETNQTYVATTSGSYNVVVTASGCPSAPSASTVVTVNQIPATPTITPGGPTTFCAGGSVTLTSSAADGNQWYLDGNPIGGATNPAYNATASGNYTVIVTQVGCSSAPSSATSVTVNPAPATPTITPGGPTTFCTGGSVTLTSSSATGNQWFLNGNPIGGETNQAYLATASGNYTVVVTASGCPSAPSSATSVTVNPIPATPTITPGGPTTFCAGGSVTLTSSSATGNQWSLNGNPIGGATSQEYVASASGSYTVVVTQSGCSSAPSSATNVTVNPAPATPTITPGGPTTFCAGGSVTLTSSSATGNQWLLNGNPIGGETNQNYVATATGNYTVTVTASGCTSAPSSATSVTVNPIPATPTITPGGPTTFCAGGSVTLTSSSATGNQWSLNGNPIGGATSQEYVASASGSYTVVVTQSGCSSAPSSATNVTVNPAPATPTITPGGPTTFCAGGSVTLTSSSATGNQWLLNGNPIGGGTNQNYVATATGNYTVTVTASGCTSAPSSATSVTVNPIPATPTITPGGPTTFCAGGSVTLTSSSASGNQWSLDGNPIGGATNQTYVATASGNYTVTVTASGCTSAPSSATSVTVNPVPATPTITPGGPTTFCAGGSVTLTSSSASGNQWSLNGSPIGGATAQQYVASVAGDYTVVVTASGCASNASAVTTVTVNPLPNATITAPGSVVSGANGSASVANAGVGASYLWTIGNGTFVGATTGNSVNFTAGAPGTLTLGVTVTTGAGCSNTGSASVTVTAAPPAVTVTNVNPNNGTYLGGRPVTITGTGFLSGASATFGGSAATSVVVVNSTTITAVTPAHAAGAVNVTVTNTNTTTGTLTNGYTYNPQQFDANGDGTIDPSDIFYLVHYLFGGGPAPAGPAGLLSGDANGDGVVDPADIFYVVNYLFLGGPPPAAMTPGRVATEGARLTGTLTLGAPVVRDGRTFIPVLVSTPSDSLAAQAMSLKLRVAGDASIVAVRRTGGPVAFEITRATADGAAYLVALGTGSLSGVVAEIEVAVAAGQVRIDVDPALTMLSRGGVQQATVAAGTLQVRGVTVGSSFDRRPNQRERD